MIKNIILDVGGVLFDDSKQKFTKILNLDIEEVTRICDIAFGKKFKQCMLGEISIIEYINEFESNTDYELLKYFPQYHSFILYAYFPSRFHMYLLLDVNTYLQSYFYTFLDIFC